MNKINILQIAKFYHPYNGGMETSIRTLVDSLQDRINFRVIATNHNPGSRIDRYGDSEIVRLASIGKIFSQPVTLGLYSCLKKGRFDIIHLHWPNPWAMLCYLAARPKGHLVVTYNCDIVKQRLLMVILRPFLRRLLEISDIIVVTSERLMHNSTELSRFKNKCRIIPHGIDLDKFRISDRIKKNADNIKQKINKPILLFVGRLVYYKGLKYLVQAMKSVEAHLFVVGRGPLGAGLKLSAILNRTSSKITWLGEISQEDLLAYYQACDIFVFPSCEKAEGFGIAMLEAFACQKPVIAVDLPTGVTTINLDRITGLVVPPKNSRALGEAINKLLSSRDLRVEYGLNGQKKVEREFNSKLLSDRFMNIYQKILLTH